MKINVLSTSSNDEVVRHLTKSEKIIKNLLRDAGNNLFFSKQASEFTGEICKYSRKKALYEAVEKHLGCLDQGFFTALNVNIGLSKIMRAEDVTEIMLELKEVILESIRRDMHPQLKHLEEIISLPTRTDRFTYIENSIKNIQMSKYHNHSKILFLPESIHRDPPLVQLYLAASQLIDNMESRHEIFDIKLLAKTVLVREELRLFEQESHCAVTFKLISGFTKKVPVVETAFLKEILNLKDSIERKAVIKKALVENNKIKDKMYNESTSEIKFKIKPGRLMDSIHIVKEELSKKGPAAKIQVNRIIEIWLESCKSIEEITTMDVYI